MQWLKAEGIAGLLIRGTSAAMAINVAGAGIALATQMVLARLLGADSFGDYVYVLSWLHLLVIFGRPGLVAATLRFAATYHARAEWGLLRGFLRRSWQMALVSSLVTAFVLAAVVWLLQSRLKPSLPPLFYLVVLLLPIFALLEMSGAGLLALKRVTVSKLPLEIVRPLLFMSSVLVCVLVLHFSASSQLLLWLFLASTIVALLLSICWHRRALPRQVLVAQPQFDTGHWAHVLIPLIMISTLAVLEIQINVLMIGPLVSTKDAGIYSAAMRLSTLAIFGFMAVNTIAAPMFSQLHANGEHHQLQRLLTLSARGLAAFTIPVCAVLILFGKPLLMLFGKEFVRAYPVLVILTASHLIDVLSGSVGFLLTMTGHQGTAARMMLLRVAIHVTLGAMLIPRFEMVGAAWALLVASVTWNLVMVVCVRKLLNLDSTMFSIFRRP